jgi:ankyrin repeat protein
MMSIFLTEHLEQKIQTMENTQLVYYFFSFQDENRNTGVTLLQSLIYQIVTKRPQLKIHLLPYIKSGNSIQPELSLEPLWAIFKKLVQDPELGTMFCVLDGLDECDKKATQILLRRLVDMLCPTSSSLLSTTFKLIVVSRDIPGLEDCTRIKLDPDNNESVHGDIEKFISVRVRDLPKIVGSRHECEIEVQDTLLERAEGTFLWVGFAMYELMQKKTWTEVFDALKTLPSGLPAIYSRMLHQIPAGHRKISSKILQWVTMALRPLKLLEIAIAIGLEPSSSSISLEHAIMDEITLCGSFLKVQDSEVTLIHQSVRDYLLDETHHNNPVLEAFKMKTNKAHFKMAQTCFQCIQQSIPQLKCPDMRESPLLRYAALHWLEHAASCSKLAAKLFDSTQSFFAHNCCVRDIWWNIYRFRNQDWNLYDKTPPLLHIACVLEIVPWVKTMVRENCSTRCEDDKMLSRCFLDQRDMQGKTALHYAASAGNYPLVKLLVRGGADVSAENHGTTALHFAAGSRKRGSEIVQLLLEQGAEVDASDYFRDTALHEAIRKGNQKVIRILLDKGASIEKIRSGRSTALHIAVESGDVETIQLLLDRGASLEEVDSDGSTALHIAVERGDVDTVQLLLDKGASLKNVDSNRPTALHIAVGWGDFDTIQLLLDRGASLEEVDSDGSTALHIAVESGGVDTVQLLLDKGADIQPKNNRGKTALHSATFYQFSRGSRFGMSDIVQLLLDRGADEDARDYEGNTAWDVPGYLRNTAWNVPEYLRYVHPGSRKRFRREYGRKFCRHDSPTE